MAPQGSVYTWRQIEPEVETQIAVLGSSSPNNLTQSRQSFLTDTLLVPLRFMIEAGRANYFTARAYAKYASGDDSAACGFLASAREAVVDSMPIALDPAEHGDFEGYFAEFPPKVKAGEELDSSNEKWDRLKLTNTIDAACEKLTVCCDSNSCNSCDSNPCACSD